MVVMATSGGSWLDRMLSRQSRSSGALLQPLPPPGQFAETWDGGQTFHWSGQKKETIHPDSPRAAVERRAFQAIVALELRDRLGEISLVAEEASAFLRADEHRPHLEATLAAAREVRPELDEDGLLEAIDLGSGDTKHAGFWTLDPIDGTKGFLRNQQYAIALAFIEDGTPTVGVMGCPNLPRDMGEPLDVPDSEGCLYMAMRNEGVYETSGSDAADKPIRLTRLDHDAGEEIAVCASVEKAHTDLGKVGEILEAHDEAQKRLAEGGWLPAEAILAGTSNANLAVTFPEELSPHYGGSSRAMWKPDDGEEGGD